MLAITSEQLAQILSHAEQAYPQECCGLLMGRQELDNRKIIVEVLPTENVWSETTAELFQDPESKDSITAPQERFTIAPEVLMQAQREGRKRHLSIIGIYHSHPDHPAIPSEFDRLWGWREYSYIIVSVEQGHAMNLLNWSLDDQHQFQPEELITIENKQ